MKLESELFYLRYPRITDADDLTRNINHRDIARWTLNIPYPYKLNDAKKFIRLAQRRRRATTFYFFVIVWRQSKEVIGGISLAHVNRASKKAELGYWLCKRFWNRGIITDAVKLILKFGFYNLKLNRIYAGTFIGNISSQRVLIKNGFQFEGKFKQSFFKGNRYLDENIYAILKSDFRKR